MTEELQMLLDIAKKALNNWNKMKKCEPRDITKTKKGKEVGL